MLPCAVSLSGRRSSPLHINLSDVKCTGFRRIVDDLNLLSYDTVSIIIKERNESLMEVGK